MSNEQTDIYLLNEHITALYKEIKELKAKLKEAEETNEELRESIGDLVSFCENRNAIQLDGNEFAPSFIERLNKLRNHE